MTTNFPTSVDAFTNPTSGDTLDNPPHDQQHADINDAMEAVQTHLLNGYLYRGRVSFTSSGTFTKASYSWLRAVKVMLVGGGGGGGSIADTSGYWRGYAGGGAAGGYSEKWIDLATLGTSETVTIGAGGAGGASGSVNAGSGGGTTSFGSHCSATGGAGGSGVDSSSGSKQTATAGKGSGGDINAKGENGGLPGYGQVSDYMGQGFGGSSRLGAGGDQYLGYNVSGVGGAGSNGSGGAGGYAGLSFTTTGTAGGNGGDGLVIVELYA